MQREFGDPATARGTEQPGRPVGHPEGGGGSGKGGPAGDPPSGARRTKAGRHAETRATLLAAARALFLEQGFAVTGTEAIVARAKVTRGALYYHFADKEALLEAVVAMVAEEINGAIHTAAAAQPRALEGLIAGAKTFVAKAAEPGTGRLYLLDAPAALGWARWRAIDARYSLQSLREGIVAVMAERGERGLDVEALTHMLSGALNEAALYVAEAAPTSLAGLEVERTIHAVVVRLFSDAVR